MWQMITNTREMAISMKMARQDVLWAELVYHLFKLHQPW